MSAKKATRISWSREHAVKIVELENEGGVEAVVKTFGYSDAYAPQVIKRARTELNGSAPMAEDKHTTEQRKEATATVRAYLESLNVPEDERRTSVEALERRKERAAEELKACDDVMKRLTLTQRLNDIDAEIADAPDNWEADFIEVAAWWGAWKGIAYETWRELGVPARVLREAEVER